MSGPSTVPNTPSYTPVASWPPAPSTSAPIAPMAQATLAPTRRARKTASPLYLTLAGLAPDAALRLRRALDFAPGCHEAVSASGPPAAALEVESPGDALRAVLASAGSAASGPGLPAELLKVVRDAAAVASPLREGADDLVIYYFVLLSRPPCMMPPLVEHNFHLTFYHCTLLRAFPSRGTDQVKHV
jgi:hypothetical protein